MNQWPNFLENEGWMVGERSWPWQNFMTKVWIKVKILLTGYWSRFPLTAAFNFFYHHFTWVLPSYSLSLSLPPLYFYWSPSSPSIYLFHQLCNYELYIEQIKCQTTIHSYDVDIYGFIICMYFFLYTSSTQNTRSAKTRQKLIHFSP